MSSQADPIKLGIITRLINGDAAADISASTQVPYPTILRYKRELKLAQEADDVHTLMGLDRAVLDNLVDKVNEEVADSAIAPQVKTILKKVETNLDSLIDLQDEFKQTAHVLNNRIKIATSEIMHVSELEILTDALCKLQNAFFNKNTTQVNVQNNYDATGNHRYQSFLGDVPTKVE
jgi:hypothetical protein